jgi:soluble lytic murein transglycosylase-like protein
MTWTKGVTVGTDEMMVIRRALIVAAAGLSVASPLAAGLEEMARSGQWRQLLQVADRRADQLPLQPEEAYLAARAAHHLGDSAAEERHLRRAAEAGDFAELARVQLAGVVVEDHPEYAIELVSPSIRRAETRSVRDAALTVAVEALENPVGSPTRRKLEQLKSTLLRSHRRRLEFALALEDPAGRRRRLGRLLADSTRDLVALDSARILQTEVKPTEEERWLVAKTLYRHALYSEAEPALEALEAVRHRAVPRWEVAYLRGRCAFRQERWDEAIDWYRKASSRTSVAERRADLEVHQGRVHELAGRMPEAVEAGQRAVRFRTTDDRRLFLARLRLRQNQPDFAWAGISRIRGRSSRARGELLLALHDLRSGRLEAARSRLRAIRRRPWNGPAAVLAAQIGLREGDFSGGLADLRRGVDDLDVYWAGAARELMASMPEAVVASWRSECAARLAASSDRSWRRTLGRWARLETEHAALEVLRRKVGAEFGISAPLSTPAFSAGLAGRLWRAGLAAEAVRWNPRGMPSGDVAAATWSASQLEQLGAHSKAIGAADEAWRMAGSDIPVRVFPEQLRRSLHPLPEPELVWRVAVDNAVPWSLLAGVAREESRWNPEVVSVVGARGLMQLMPATAVGVAQENGSSTPTLDGLFDPELSLELGAAEIARLLEVFDGQWAAAVAAYNAGETQAKLWLEQCGDPCSSELYVANISFSTTRKYTSDVLSSASTYVELYGASLGANGDGDR